MRNLFGIINKNLIVIFLLIFGFIVFADLANIDRYIHKQFCTILDLFFESSCTDFYDIRFWEFLVSIGTISAAISAFFAIRQSIKQLEVEQEPYVVADGAIILVGNGWHEVTLKNVGRGSALRITCATDKKDRDKAFFEDGKSHSYYLSMNEKMTSLASGDAITQIREKRRNDGYCYFYIFYVGQIGKSYMTEVKMKLPDEGGERFVIMENNRFKL